MANSVLTSIELDGKRRAVARIVGVLDTEDLVYAPAVSLGAVSNNSATQTLQGFAVESISFDGTPGLVIQLAWNSATPQLIAGMDTKADFNFRDTSNPSANQNVPGYDGSLNVSSKGYIPGTVMTFTLVLSLIKRYA